MLDDCPNAARVCGVHLLPSVKYSGLPKGCNKAGGGVQSGGQSCGRKLHSTRAEPVTTAVNTTEKCKDQATIRVHVAARAAALDTVTSGERQGGRERHEKGIVLPRGWGA